MPNFTLPDEVFQRAAQQFPTPFHLYDEGGIRRAVRGLQRAFSGLPRYKEYFAVKALPNPHVLKVLLDEDCGLDCASEAELLMAKRLGLRGDDIMFSANAMPPHEFKLARELGAIINLDDITDIDTLLHNGGIPDVVSMRFNPGGDFGNARGVMGRPQESKFGFTRAQLSEGLERLKQLGAKGFGLHAFLASNMLDEAYYPLLARLLMETGQELEKESGLPLKFINLSGGIGIPYLPEQAPTDIDLVGRRVLEHYRELLGEPREDGVQIKTELGRYITGPYGWLVSRAMHEKRTYKHYIGLDACASNLLRPAMYGAYHHISICGKRHLPATHTYDITGALCENNDKFAIDRPLPEIALGDLVLIHDAGAHAAAMGYQYNGRLRCAEVLHREDGSFQLIRRGETVDDYFATLVGEGLPAF